MRDTPPVTPRWRAMIEHGNDAPFGSDGGGISWNATAALRRGVWFGGAGIVAATPELRRDGDVGDDPLEERARLMAWAGRHGASRAGTRRPVDWSLAIRAGVGGGVADRTARTMQDAVHRAMGIERRVPLPPNGTGALAGLSGHWRMRLAEVASADGWTMRAEPYLFASAGTDAVDAGGGAMLAFQRAGAEAMVPWRPGTGTHAPLFGGDGFALFGAVRAVASDRLYGEATALVTVAGASAQASFGPTVLRAVAACGTRPYQQALRIDCRARARAGLRF